MDLTASFRYLSPAARLYAGVDALSNLYREAQRLEATRAFVVCSETVARTTNLLERTKESLGDLYAGVFDGAKRESPIPSVMAGVEAAKARAGGHDCRSRGWQRGGHRPRHYHPDGGGRDSPGAVHQVPSGPAAGQPPSSAAQAPQHPGAHHAHQRRKSGWRRRYGRQAPVQAGDVRPQGAPNLHHPGRRGAAYRSTAPVPGHGQQHLHCGGGRAPVPGLNPFAYADLRQALELSLEYLPRLVSSSDDPEPRIQLGAAAIISNRAADAPSGGGRGAGTTLDRQIRYRYSHVGQGASNAVLLATSMRRNREVALEGQARLADIMGVREVGMSDAEAAEEATQAVDSFLRSIGVPSRIRDLDVPEADLEAIARDDAAQPSFGEGSRRITDAAELTRFLQEAW